MTSSSQTVTLSQTDSETYFPMHNYVLCHNQTQEAMTLKRYKTEISVLNKLDIYLKLHFLI